MFGSHARCGMIFFCVKLSLCCRMPCFPGCYPLNANSHSSRVFVTSKNASPQCPSNNLSFAENYMEWYIIAHEKYMKFKFQYPKMKVLLEHSHAYLKFVKICFLSCYVPNYILSSVLRVGPQSLKYLLSGSWQKKFANPQLTILLRWIDIHT